MKPHRIPLQPSQQSDFGLIAWLEQTRVALPLKGVECQFQINGAVASVELDQIYHQNTAMPLDCTYTFPLPAGAAVYRCEVNINGRIIRAKVEEENAAREIYRAQKAAGRRAVLVETERENLFTLALGNVQPGDVIVVCFAWFQVLDRAGDGLRLMVPTCPGIRYIPGQPLLRALAGRGIEDDTDQVPDASRISPPRIDALHPDAAYFWIGGRLPAADVESGTASSPSHPLLVRQSGDTVSIQLSERSAVPDRDFVLEWKEPKVAQFAPQAWRWSEAGETYALLQLRAPQEVNVAENVPQDFYFLVDRSGSMQGRKWRCTCEALRAFVALLGANDRVWITLFEAHYQDFGDVPMPAPAVLADTGFRRMEALGATGGTELLPAAIHVLEKIAAHSSGRRTSVILITDGEVGNEEAVMRAFQPAGVMVHTFGIDTTVNDAFLKSLARRNRGACWLQTPNDDIAGTVAALGDRLRRPVLSDLEVKGSWESGDGVLPNLHAREIVTLSLRGTTTGPLEISGLLPDGSTHAFTVSLDAIGSEALKLVWAQQRIAALLSADRRQEAITLAKTHNLLCKGAAFIAWDEQEQVPIAKAEVTQPAFEPQAMMDVAYHTIAAPEYRFARSMRQDEHASPRVPDEAELKAIAAARMASLRKVLQEAGIPISKTEQLINWAESADSYRRHRVLSNSATLLSKVRQTLGTLFVLDRTIPQALAGTPEALVAWGDAFAPMSKELESLIRKIEQANIESSLVERFLTWILESGGFDRARLKAVAAFVESLKTGPFSGHAREQRWQQFRDGAVAATA